MNAKEQENNDLEMKKTRNSKNKNDDTKSNYFYNQLRSLTIVLPETI